MLHLAALGETVQLGQNAGLDFARVPRRLKTFSGFALEGPQHTSLLLKRDVLAVTFDFLRSTHV